MNDRPARRSHRVFLLLALAALQQQWQPTLLPPACEGLRKLLLRLPRRDLAPAAPCDRACRSVSGAAPRASRSEWAPCTQAVAVADARVAHQPTRSLAWPR